MSAPPDNRTTNNMSGHQEHHPHGEQASNVRHIPIFVEGRDEPVINKNVDHSAHFGETKPTYVPPPPQPHIDRDQYFADDGPASFHHPPNFSRTFGTPFNKGFRQGPQPFVQQKVYPQTAFARGASPQRSQSPKPQMHPEEHYAKVPVHHEQAAPKTEPPSRAQQKPPQQQQHPQKQAPPQPQPQQQQRQQTPQREQTPPPPKQPFTNDPIAQILSIQTDVLNLMTDVENFTGSKKDKRYMFLDEMLTRNLIKLDNIETDGKENIRLARKEAIRCIQKCIAVLEAKAEKGSNAAQVQAQDVEMNPENGPEAHEQVAENGEVEINEAPKEDEKVEPQVQQEQNPVEQPQEQPPVNHPEKEMKDEPKQEEKVEVAPTENLEVAQPQVADTRTDEKASENTTETIEEMKTDETVDKKPKKGTKIVKKRDKSKENKDTPKDSNKDENLEQKEEKLDVMQVDDKGDIKTDSQVMDVDGAASQ